ncbi:hypothetical protein WR25_21706 isoform I [Diploscapter pachys]|uniref:Tetraspanin n=1 Tax=Diploscapter pachys TaxID=2018661 RepID=A0A2A2LCM0_9BILA|nr:hypothetical protein WR25_21706 isoform D [Diploscapter pachys]PAV83962.1 hypothetical protein WR25_21706 isoform I [Diploscapter pachys]
MSLEIQDNDFLELKRLDMVFGLFVAAACLLVLTFLLVTYATIKKSRFLLWVYCAVIALCIVVQLIAGLLSFNYADQINQLASDEILYESLGKVIDRSYFLILMRKFKLFYRMGRSTKVPNDDESQFWSHTQQTLSCCGVFSLADWKNGASRNLAGLTDTQITSLNCYQANANKGCEKEMRSRINTDAQYLGAASMAVLVVEVSIVFKLYNLTKILDSSQFPCWISSLCSGSPRRLRHVKTFSVIFI